MHAGIHNQKQRQIIDDEPQEPSTVDRYSLTYRVEFLPHGMQRGKHLTTTFVSLSGSFLGKVERTRRTVLFVLVRVH